VKEQPEKGQPEKGQPEKGQPEKGQPVKEQPEKGQPVKEQPVKEQAATRLARHLAALPAPEMRHVAFLRYLEETDLDQAVSVLARIQQLGRQGGPPFDVALLAVAGALGRELIRYEQLAELYRAAKEGGFDALGQLFFSGTSEAARPKAREDEQRELTLGHRKSMARSVDPNVLGRLLLDPELPVVRHLLENPRLVERDIVQLAARRPADPEIQREIFASSRWIARYSVKRPLVLNPRTPTEIAIRLLGFFVAGDLRLVQQSPTLPQAVRDAAEQLAALKHER